MVTMLLPIGINRNQEMALERRHINSFKRLMRIVLAVVA